MMKGKSEETVVRKRTCLKESFVAISSIIVVVLAASSTVDAADSLESGFRSPPAAARPHTYWFWMNGNVTRAGITADLEAMRRVGIGGALIMNVAGSHGCDIPRGEADYLGDAWLDLLEHAAREADR